MTFDVAITQYLVNLALEVWPDLDEDQIRASIPEATFDDSGGLRTNTAGRDSVGRETATVLLAIDADKFPDRLALVRRLGHQRVALADGSVAIQRYQRCQRLDYVEAVKMKSVVFTIQYTYDIWEEEP